MIRFLFLTIFALFAIGSAAAAGMLTYLTMNVFGGYVFPLGMCAYVSVISFVAFIDAWTL